MDSAVLDREPDGVAEIDRYAPTRVTVLDQPALSRVYRGTDAERAALLGQFRELKARGYFCYREDGGGAGGTVLHTLDETATDLVFVPRMVGG